MSQPVDPKDKVTPLPIAATPAAMWGAIQKAATKAETAADAAGKAYEQAREAREYASDAKAQSASASRGAWAAHGAINNLRDKVVVPELKAIKDVQGKQAEAIASLSTKLDTHATRTAEEIIRITAEQTRIARQGGSSPQLEHMAQLGIRLAELHVEDEATEVKQRKAAAEQEAKDKEAKAKRRDEVRGLVITWATRAGLVIGPLLTMLLMRYCQ